MTIQSIFKLILTAVFVASLSLTSVLAQDSASTESTSGKAAESVREKLKNEKEARKAALEKFKEAEKEQNSTRKLTSIQTLANKLIAEREKALSQAKTKTAEVKCTTAKTDINTAIEVVSANLTSQKAEISAATSVEAVRTLIKEGIIGENHVIVAVLPALRGMCASKSIIELLNGRLATIVTKLKAAGLDTTTLEKYLSDAKTNAQASYDAYKAVANNPGVTTYKTDLEAAKTKLKESKTLLGLAKDEAEKLRDQFSASAADSTKESTN